MQVLLYQGLSIVSKLIRLQTRSKFSHAAVRLTDGSVVESWASDGVRHMKTALDGHHPATIISIFHVDGDYSPELVEKFLLDQVGKKYDFRSVFRFMSRRDASTDPGPWFCSELVIAAFRAGGLDLLHGPASHISPRDVGLSPFLSKITTVGGYNAR